MFQDKLQPLPRLPRQDEILIASQRHVSEHRKVIADITTSVSLSSACFDNVLGPIAEIENRQSGERAVILALRYAAVDMVTQEAVEEAERMWLKYSAEVDQNVTLFKLLHAIGKKHESLDAESQKLLDRFLMRYTECGHGSLNSRSIQEWQDNRQNIEALCADFNRNVRQLNSDAISIHFTQEELDGVPTHDLEEYPLTDGVRRIPLQWRPYVSILRHAHNPQTRKRIQLAWGQKLPQNVQLFRRIISLRHKNARLRGYKTHAASRLPYRMAMSIDWVENLLEDLSKALIEVGKKNFAQLQQKKNEVIAKDKDTPQNAKIEAWDVPYYNRLIDNKAMVDQDKVMEYFPLTQTFKSMLDLFSTYLQLRFDQLPAETVAGHIWAPEVQVWSVWDKRPGTENDFIGYLYVDILGRTNKYKGNQAVNLQPGYLKSDNTRVYPISTLMCNFSPASRNGCSLLRHGQVITLFHELGHCMHDLVARTKYAKFHGYEVCLEFGEGIATMLENWCWIKDELKAISKHYTRVDHNYMEAWMKVNPGCPLPPAEIPDKLVDDLISTRREDRVDLHLGQLCDSLFDLGVHNPSSDEALESLDETKLYIDLKERFSFTRRPEPCYLHTTFNHLVSGYDAGYYAYICANVFAEDLFKTAFAGNYRSQTAWDRFRREVLEYGGGRDEWRILEDFLGHTPDLGGLLESIGI